MSVPRMEATFRSLLREHRLAAGLTQEALSERSGVSPRTIQEIEAGGVQPRRATVVHLADALGLSGPDRDELIRMGLPRPRQRIAATPDDGAARHVVSASVPVSEPPADQAIREPSLVALPRPAPTNVPWPVSNLLGREAELEAIRALFTTNRQRLVTLTGVGGSGKSRLAVELAHDLLDVFVDGVWFVELASTASPALVPRVVAGALGVREIQNVSILDALLGFLRRKRLLLVLDNCEHLIEACAELAGRLLTACPDLAILATSREPLGIVGEQRRQLRPLDVPDRSGTTSFEALAGIASVRLFVERACSIDPDFALTETNAASVAQVCARLDGIPLAIELAASRMSVLAVDQIAERLDDAFRLLAGATRSGPTRQQTMEAALDWSYALLTPAEQAAFRALGVFAGGFTLEAAEAIADDGSWVIGDGGPAGAPSPNTQHPTPDTLDVLSRLVEKSLIVAGHSPDGRRYRLLEPVRQYAVKALAESGEERDARGRHAAYFAALAERAAPMLHGPEQVAWLDRLEEVRDNLRAALGWIAEHGQVEDGLRLAAALGPYWHARGYLSEGRDWLRVFLEGPHRDGGSADARLRALLAAGYLASWQGDLIPATELLSATLRQAEALGDRHLEVTARIWLSTALRRQGDVQQALDVAEAGLRQAYELADESLIALALLRGGIVYRDAEAPDRAVPALEASVTLYRRLGDTRSIAIAVTMLGWALLEAGDHSRAEPCLRDGAIGLKQVGDQSFFLFALRGLAYVAHKQHEDVRAARWYGASEALRVALGMHHPQRILEHDRAFLTAVQARLAASAFDRALADGKALTFEQVSAEIVAST